MNPQLIAIAGRDVKRLLIVIAGGMSVFLGYRMFIRIPKAVSDGQGHVRLPGGTSIYVTHVGPGVFFALFGAIVLSLSIHQSVTLSNRDATTVDAKPAVDNTQYALSTARVGDTDVQQHNVLNTVRQLATVAAALRAQEAVVYLRKNTLISLSHSRMRARACS